MSLCFTTYRLQARGEEIEQELEEYVSRRHAAEDRQQLAAAAGKGSHTP